MLARLEHNVVLPSGLAGALPALDLSRHQGTPVGKRIDKALGRKTCNGYPKLDLLYSTDVQRIARRLTYNGSVVELALDQGRVFCNTHSQAICELEFELKEGVPLDAIKLARQWCAAHSLWISTISKSMKGQRLSGVLAAVSVKSTCAPYLPRCDAGQDLIATVIKACLSQILPNLSEIAGGNQQPEQIHDLRVGIRRLRTALRELGGLTENVEPAWETALATVFSALGDHRDHTHLAQVLQPEWLAAGGPTVDFKLSGSNLPDLGKAVRAQELQDALLGLLAFVHRHPVRIIDKAGDVKKFISARLNKLHTRAMRDGKKFSSLDPLKQHGVRKRFKRLRYLIDFSASLYPARSAHHMATALKPIQDALGVHNDELMALHTLSLKVAVDPGAWFGMGWLTSRRKRNASRCLKEIKGFAGVKPFWKNQANI